MAFLNSKRYGTGVQHYNKVNGDVSFYITFKDENNKLKRIKIGDKSKGITEPFCNQKRNEIINSIKLGTDLPIKHKKKTSILFDTIAQKYFEELKIHSNKNTVSNTVSKYNTHLLKPLGQLAINRIELEDLENIQKIAVKTLALKTVNQIIELFSTIFNFSVKKDLCNITNPAIKIKKFKVNTRERFLTKDEIVELYEALKDNEFITLFVKFALTTGARLDSLLHIQKKDIDLMSKTLVLYNLKNTDTYKGFLTDDIIKIIQPKLEELKANDYIISLDGKKSTTKRIQWKLKPILDKLFNVELEKDDRKHRVVIHSLRHTFASHSVIQGTPIFTIQNLMNHKDIKQTMRYAKLAPDSGRNFVNDLYR